MVPHLLKTQLSVILTCLVLTLFLNPSHGLENLLGCSGQLLCSAGQVHSYSGNVDRPGILAETVQRCSFNNELILLLTSSSRMLDVVEVITDFQQLGISHILVLSESNAQCARLHSVVDGVCCVWSTISEKELLLARIVLCARILRFGVNTMFMDSDQAIHANPYYYLKQGPLADQQLIVGQGSQSGKASLGFVYHQAYRVDGPAAYVVAQLADVLMRVFERNGKLSLWDQFTFWDTLASARIGRPFFLHSQKGYPSTWGSLWKPLAKLLNLSEPYTDSLMTFLQPAAPDASFTFTLLSNWTVIDAVNDTQLRVMELRMPNCRAESRAELGSSFLQPRGRLATELWATITQESGNAMFPDAFDASQATAADASPAERFAWAPAFFYGDYPGRGRFGAWDAAATRSGVVENVVSHRAGLPQAGKVAMRMAMGWHRWDMKARLNIKPYFASTDEEPVPPVLAYHPDLLQLLRPATQEQWLHIIRSLASVATLAARALAMPAIACSSAVVGPAQGRGGTVAPEEKSLEYPYKVDSRWLPFGSAPEPWCFDMRVACGLRCLPDVRMLLPWEAQHLVQHGRHASNAQGRRAMTLTLPRRPPVRGLSDASVVATVGGRGIGTVVFTMEELQELLALRSQQPVVYLRHVVSVEGLLPQQEAAVRKIVESCGRVKA